MNNYAIDSLSRELCLLFNKKQPEFNDSQKKACKTSMFLLLRYFQHKRLCDIRKKHVESFRRTVEAIHETPKALNKCFDLLNLICEEKLTDEENFMVHVLYGRYEAKSKSKIKTPRVIDTNKRVYQEGTAAYEVCLIIEQELDTDIDLRSAYRKIIKVIGPDKLLSDLRVDDFHAIRNHCLGEGFATPRTWNKVLPGLKSLNQRALNKKAINFSFIDLKYGFIKPGPPKKKCYTETQLKTIFHSSVSPKNELSKLLFLISCHLMSRGCEAIALRHSSVEFEMCETLKKEIAHVTISLSKSAGHGSSPEGNAYKCPKTNDNRIVTVDPICAELLKRAIEISNEVPACEYFKLSDDKTHVETLTDRFIFINPVTGKPWPDFR